MVFHYSDTSFGNSSMIRITCQLDASGLRDGNSSFKNYRLLVRRGWTQLEQRPSTMVSQCAQQQWPYKTDVMINNHVLECYVTTCVGDIDTENGWAREIRKEKRTEREIRGEGGEMFPADFPAMLFLLACLDQDVVHLLSAECDPADYTWIMARGRRLHTDLVQWFDTVLYQAGEVK